MSSGALAPQPIVALDVASLAEARQLVARLGEAADFYKVGLQLFTAEGPPVVEWLRAQGKRVFLDLKFYDIPNTVRGATASASRTGATLLTVHAQGGADMLRAAVEGAGDATGVLAVTVLTSMDHTALGASLGRAVNTPDEVLRYAEMAATAGAHGVVCAGSECAAVRERFPRLRPLVPGIRASGGAAHDQARVVTPREAALAGAAYVILGRAVTAADDPPAAFAALVAELRGAS